MDNRAVLAQQPAGIRISHWINALSFAGLLVSGVAILLAHPRLYWGETGTVDVPALVDLPLPFVFGHSGWGRSLHFLAAWVCVLNGLFYVVTGLGAQRFGRGFRMYGALQRRTYVAVVFALFPLMVWTGLAMSPAVTSVIPWMVELLTGQQSARTIHFVVATALVLFSIGHMALAYGSRPS